MLFYDKLKKDQQNRARQNALNHEVAQRELAQRGLAQGANCQAASQSSRRNSNTNIQNCIDEELRRYFELLDGQPPSDLYRMVMSQVENTLIAYVLEECGNNQSRAAEYLGISRGTLRNKLTEQGLI